MTLSPLVDLLRCLECHAPVQLAELAPNPGYPDLGPDGWLRCTGCPRRYPVIAGSPRMLDSSAQAGLAASYPDAAITIPIGGQYGRTEALSVKQRTAESFAYEWRQFGQPRPQWRKNFLDYLQPHSPDYLDGKLVLDVGAGSGRHSAQAAAFGARVVAVDLGRSIDVARQNLPPDVLTVQADGERLPFDPSTFEFVMSIGVIHHLEDPERALRSLLSMVAPAGRVHVYVYWVPERALHRTILRLVTATRRLTVRMPHRPLHWLCYPVSLALWVGIVRPYRALRGRNWTRRLGEALPLKTYADYPFGVLVNDTFDRFSAPIEHRLTRAEVIGMLERAGLEQVVVIPNHGWIGDGMIPQTSS